MTQRIHTIPKLTLGALKMFIRNKQSLFFTLFMPFIIMTIFGLIGFDKPMKIDIGVVTNSPTAETTEFVEQLKAIEAFVVHTGAIDDERTALEKGDRTVVLQVPDALMPNRSGQPGALTPQTLTVFTNDQQPQQVQTALTILNQILDKTTLAAVQAPTLFTIATESISTRNIRYIDFLLPGIVGMSIMQMAVFSVAFVFADYKEKGILKRLVATPMKPFQFVTANVITRLLVAILQTAVLIALGVLLYKSTVVGSYWLILLISILGGTMFLGLGFTISGLAKTVEAVPAIANLIVFPMLFLGGTFFPLTSMPDWLQHVVTFLPLQYFTDALRQVMTQGAGIGAIAHDLYWMIGWSVVMVVLANFTFSLEEKRV